MSPETLIKYVVELYRSSKRSGLFNEQIKRGMQPSIANKIEDLFALFLCTNLSSKFRYFLEYNITSPILPHSARPDITITQSFTDDNRIIALFDLKTDIGYSRSEFPEFCIKKNNWLEELKGSSVNFSYGKDINVATLSENIKYYIVLISNTNISAIQFKEHYDFIKKLPNIKLFYLTSGKSPNTKDIQFDKLVKEIEINNDAFNEILKDLDLRYIENAEGFLNENEFEELQLASEESGFKVKNFELNEVELENHYSYRIDKIFGHYWKHRTLRTIFDPWSHEYSETTIDQKIDYLKKIINSGEKLEILIRDYEFHYYDQNRKDIAESAKDALIALLSKSLNENLINKT
jgi:hypothetical protein